MQFYFILWQYELYKFNYYQNSCMDIHFTRHDNKNKDIKSKHTNINTVFYLYLSCFKIYSLKYNFLKHK